MPENRFESVTPPHVRRGKASSGRVPPHFVYILTCADGTFYTGYTTDPERRLREHNAGTASKYTRIRLPVTLSFLEGAPSRGAALRREFEVKRLSRRNKMLLCREYSPVGAPSSR